MTIIQGSRDTSIPSLRGNGGGEGLRLLCIRFSAIGDVAMTVPVIKSLALARPDIHIIMISRPFAKAFFEGLAENVEFVGLDLKKKRYKGFLGIEHVYHDIKVLKPDMVADLHDVIRTKFARVRFHVWRVPVASIDKHRQGRRALTRQDDKILVQQPTSFEKYYEVFQKLGVKSEELGFGSLEFPFIDEAPLNLIALSHKTELSFFNPQCSIGIAPFAAHEGKIYPFDKTEEVISLLLAKHPDMNILLFGGKREKELFDRWCRIYDRVIFASEKCHGMREELAVMQRLKCMVSMDSSNMHMASLVGTPVVSIWGGTHPFAGFMGWRQSTDDVIQVDLPCRPCSVYGNKPCLRGDYACLYSILPQTIVSQIEKHL